MSEPTMSDKQYTAKILFTRERLEQKVIAKRVGVSEPTISKWVNVFNWRSLRDRLLVGKEEILSNLYEQLSELNEAIQNKPKGERWGDSKQADIQIKLTASIRNLETELAIADLVESGIRFMRYMQANATHEEVMLTSSHWNDFIQHSIRK